MKDKNNEYVEIKYKPGSRAELPDKINPDALPEIFVNNSPVAFQDVSYSSAGKGSHISYSSRPTVSIDFSTDHFPLPLRNKLHKHDYFELLIISSDKFEMQIESRMCEFSKWDVCLLNRSTRHSEHFIPGMKVFYLVLSPKYLLNWSREEGMNLQRSSVLARLFSKGLRDTMQQNKDYITFKYTGQNVNPPLYKLLEDIRKEFEDKQPGYQLFIRGLICRLLFILVNPEHYDAEYIDLGSDDGFSLAYSAKQIMDKNKRRMTKQQLAEKLNYNSEHINRVFKKHYGQTIPDYNKLVCMREAALLLCNTNQHIHQICRQLGFTNRTHFYTLFQQEYGCSPYDYRKRGGR